jgi:two-component system phosphate regulon response regulator PhoB/two-component system alkaline phosphatase synthesis response regulator PhoP
MTAKNAKILLIEDDQMIATMYQTKFTMEGITLQTAVDGAEGLEKARQLKPDIILLDIILPKLDGFAVLKELKADPALKSVPVVLLTNLGQDDDIKKGKDLGADDYFVKSNHTPAEIVAKVKEMLK